MTPVAGTSPRTRGKHQAAHCPAGHPWNIPAHAGKTPSRHPGKRGGWEHPRARGENPMRGWVSAGHCGTSPRTRGKPNSRSSNSASARNIPAHAGKTLIDVRFLVPEGHFTFDFVFLHRGGSMESPCSSLLSECFSARIVVYGQLGTSLLSAYGCAFWWDGG